MEGFFSPKRSASGPGSNEPYSKAQEPLKPKVESSSFGYPGFDHSKAVADEVEKTVSGFSIGDIEEAARDKSVGAPIPLVNQLSPEQIRQKRLRSLEKTIENFEPDPTKRGFSEGLSSEGGDWEDRAA